MVGKSGGGGGAAEEDGAAAVRRWVEAGGGRLVMDGGLATELEANGADLNDPLWSAKCLLSSSHLIRKSIRPKKPT
uniref:Hcy-binding domain-containing protein n=1 Tax=Oryza glaberrima TaxID=4538 RepID=I1R7Q3_ORYGL